MRLLGKFGLVAPKGFRRLVELRRAMEEARPDVLPEEARAAVVVLFEHLDALTEKLGKVEQEILAWQKASAESQRLATAPGMRPLTATALVAAVGDGARFQSARHFAA